MIPRPLKGSLPASPREASSASPEQFIGSPLGSALLISLSDPHPLGHHLFRTRRPRPRWGHRTPFPHRLLSTSTPYV